MFVPPHSLPHRLKQQEMSRSVLDDHVHEAMKPLARYEDDADLDKMQVIYSSRIFSHTCVSPYLGQNNGSPVTVNS